MPQIVDRLRKEGSRGQECCDDGSECCFAPWTCCDPKLLMGAADEIERLRVALVEIADPTLNADERRNVARAALGWSEKE